MHTVQILNHFVGNHQVLAYLFIFFVMIFEGEVTIITTGILSYLRVLNFWLSLFAILAGGMVKTFGGYYLGGFLYKKFNHHRFFRYLEKQVLYFMPNFRQKPFWSIFLSKFIIGMNNIVTIFSGYSEIDFRIYFRAEVLSTIIWAPVLLSLGFFFSRVALSLSKEVTKFILVIFIFLALFFILDKLIAVLYRIFQYLETNDNGK